MKKIILTLGLGIALFAGETNQETGAVFIGTHSLYNENINVTLSSKKPLVIGNNEIFARISKQDVPFTGKAKLKVFMPEMPGMAYMEFENKGKVEKGIVKFDVNFSMSGTWQYNLKFKDSSKVNTVRGSLNL